MGGSSNCSYTRSSWVPYRLIFHTHEKAVHLFRNVSYAMPNDPRNYCQFFCLTSFRGQSLKSVNMSEKCRRSVTETSDLLGSRGLFFKSPETIWAFFRRFNSLYICVTQRFYVIKLRNHLGLSYVQGMLKDKLVSTKGLQFDNWLFMSETFSGLLRNRSKARVALSLISAKKILLPYTHVSFVTS